MKSKLVAMFAILCAVGSATQGEDRPPEVIKAQAEAKQRQNKTAKDLGIKIETTNSMGMKLVLIPAGEFMMGSPPEIGPSDEKPQHRVEITKAFYIGMYEVTQQQYEAVMGKNPSRFEGDSKPVEQVSWDDARAFCKKLSRKEGQEYRLPTEAEWEYACRAGTSTPWHHGRGITQVFDYVQSPTSMGPHPVGGKKNPNAWGVYDMNGNVWEWCNDWYGEYKSGAFKDPQGPRSGEYRVLRGGSWRDRAPRFRSANRDKSKPAFGCSFDGFRVVCTRKR